MHFEYRFDNNWEDIWRQLAMYQEFTGFVDQIVLEGGVGLISGEHFVGKSYLTLAVVENETLDRKYFKLAPQTRVAEFYKGLYPYIPKLTTQRSQLLDEIERWPIKALFFDNAADLNSELLNEISYLYDQTEGVGIFFVDVLGDKLANVPTRLKTNWQKLSVQPLTPIDYHLLLKLTSDLFAEDQQLSALMQAMENPAHVQTTGSNLCGGFDVNCKFVFRSCLTIGQFAKVVGQLTRAADRQGLTTPALGDYFVPRLKIS